MPELPEVEVVRRGLQRWVVGREISSVEVLHPRPVRRHVPGVTDFAARLVGTRVRAAVRRGKYLWLELASGTGEPTGEALLAHLGMSGQLLVSEPGAPAPRHLRVTIGFADDGPELRFVDQRMFGGLAVVPLVEAATHAGADTAPDAVPREVAHIARDPLDPAFDEREAVERMRRRRTGVKRALLDQTLVSGIGNIYADEALWRARLHYARPTDTLTRPAARALLGHARDVMNDALAQGGTSFDALYVDVNGASGYFDRSLAVYGQEGRPCPRCGTPVRRDAFMNRSAFTCPRCQPRPRNGRW